jgi:plastocyanin
VLARCIAAGWALAFAVSAANAEPRSHTVVIDGMKFAPATLTVERGDQVVWTNKDLVPHTATASGKFDSKSIAPGASWTWVADGAAAISYVCTLHPGMKASLVVH